MSKRHTIQVSLQSKELIEDLRIEKGLKSANDVVLMLIDHYRTNKFDFDVIKKTIAFVEEIQKDMNNSEVNN